MMKTISLKISSLLMLFALMGAGCEKENTESPNLAEGYVVGTFICDKIDRKNGEALGHKTHRGYCVLLKNSKNKTSPYPMDFYTFDSSDNLFIIPEELLSIDFDGSNCGPYFFPDSLRNAYKIKFEYQILSEFDKSQFACGSCTTMELMFPWEDYSQIELKNITINN